MAKYLHHARLVILIGLVVSTHADVVRNPYFFQNQTQRCNCESNEQCNNGTGTCPRDKCAFPYVGINCQHADVRLSMGAHQTNVPKELLDGDDTTCLQYWKGTAFFRIQKPIYFIWIYIFKNHPVTVVRPRDDWMKSINVVLYEGSNRPKTSMYILKLSENSLLIKSQNDVMYDHLSISNLPKDICSLEVSLGRNLAISSTPTGVQNAGRAIDGSEKYTHECPVLERTQYRYDNYGWKQWWQTRLLHDARINNIQIVGMADRCQYFNIHFEFTTNTGEVMIRFYGAFNEVLPRLRGRTRINVNLNALVREVLFYLIDCRIEDAMAMYELYIFGEFHCPKPEYGAQCERHCDPDWGCLQGCNNTWTGDWCGQSNASEPDASKSSLVIDWRLYLTLAVIGVLLVVVGFLEVKGRLQDSLESLSRLFGTGRLEDWCAFWANRLVRPPRGLGLRLNYWLRRPR